MRKIVHTKHSKRIRNILCLILTIVLLVEGGLSTALATEKAGETPTTELSGVKSGQVLEKQPKESLEDGMLEESDAIEDTEVATESELEETEETESESEETEEIEESEILETIAESESEETETTLMSLPITPLSGGGPTGSSLDAPSYGQISLVKFSKMANGSMGGMALDNAGNVWTFGYNLYGQLGIGLTSAQQNYYGGMKRIPYFRDNGIKIVDIASSYETRYALSDDGKIYAWGHGSNGAMGNGSSTSTNTTPAQVPGLPTIAEMFVSDSYINEANVFALGTDGTLWAWGYNNSGVLGLGNTTTTNRPTLVTLDADFTDGTRSIVEIAVGCRSAFLLDNLGDLWITGQDTYGEHGNGTGTSTDLRNFTKMDRSLSGIGRVVDVDASYSRLQVNGDRIVAADENDDVWEWGVTYGDGTSANSRVAKQTPTKIILDASEVAAIGYTPKPTAVISSEMVAYFIDQYGRPWGWGSGYYFGFGTDGPYTVNNSEMIRSTAARQVPAYIGDGDTQRYNSDGKYPLYREDLEGTLRPESLDVVGANNMGYGFNDRHPTIYDEKYMLKDANGNVLDVDGRPLRYAVGTTTGDGIAGLTRGKYYLSSGGTANTILSPAATGVPAINPDDALWINLAFQDVPYIMQMDVTLSAYAFIDADGNLFKWGNDGSGAIAWGWDFEDKYDQNGSLQAGLYDRYTYEVMYMRGAPTVDYANLTGSISGKIYTDEGTTADNKATINLHVPRSSANEALGADVLSDVSELKYVFIPYDENDENFNVNVSSLSYAEFMEIYNAASVKGDLIDSTISSGNEVQDIEIQVDAPQNGRIIVFGVNERYVSNTDGSREYENVNTFATSILVDNVYTKTLMAHKGIGQHTGESDVELYGAATDNVVKKNDDSADTGKPFDPALYGLPLDVNGNVIGTTVDGDGNVTVIQAPRYGYDTVEIKSYEATGDVGLPSGIKPYWKFKEYLSEIELQLKMVELELTDLSYVITTVNNPETGDDEEVYYSHEFIYEKNLDYWTDINGIKVWDDQENEHSLRPDFITLTLKQYKRDTDTGEKTAYLMDVSELEVTEGEDGNWFFDFGSQMSYEYTYEIVEEKITGYDTTIVYSNYSVTTDTKEDLTGIVITNTLSARPFEFKKIDAVNDAPLSGAEFKIYSWEGAEPIPDVVENDAINDDNGWKLLETQTSGADGMVNFETLVGTTFQLIETVAPNGYSRPVGQWRLTFEDGEWKIVAKGVMLPPAFSKDDEGNLAVVNMKNKFFPLSGFEGIGKYTLIGLGVITLSVVFFLFSRRRKIDINELIYTKGGRGEKN
jgi:alpha-tubulin suppressor-like RCC1 family protein